MGTRSPANRIDIIDFWRGFALLTIFIDHMPDNAFQHVTYRNFGFSDAAELFVFLSGASVALAYGSRFFKGETWAAVRAVLRRAFTLYWVQILISLLIVGLLAAAALYWDNDDLVEDPDRDLVVSSPVRGIAAMLVLAHQLGNVNILPLYIALLLTTPALLLLARRNDWLMLAGSAALYVVARALALNLPSWPLDGGWYFNPLAWQFLFAIGLFVGRRARDGGIAYDRRLFALCAVIVAGSAFAVTNGFRLVPGLWSQASDVIDHSKTDLGLFRLVHFLALAYLIGHSGVTRVFRATPIFAPLSLIGRYSLPVFATGCVLTAIGEVMVETRPDDYAYPLTLGAFIVVVGVVLHYLVARLLAARRTAQPRPALVPAANVQLVGQVSTEGA
ncbi:MAG TPA: OpgC domain-containing protein [Xanthobacteraceae bacterium]|nr:OpgC domain-containing protein [Xanthobacteraceae bacterium]